MMSGYFPKNNSNVKMEVESVDVVSREHHGKGMCSPVNFGRMDGV
jgi:hypothetical protein